MYRETRERHPSSESCHNCSSSPARSEAGSQSGSAKMARSPSPLSRSLSENPSGHASNTGYCGKRKYSMVKFGYHLAVPSSRPTEENADPDNTKGHTPHVIALVGLPARGKTYIAKKLSRYLNWIGINTRVFNLGEYRRKLAPKYNDASFFNPSNQEGNKLREKVCTDALDDVIRWLNTDDGEVAVFDATNTTRKRRRLLYETFVVKNKFHLFFVESICQKQDIIELNIKEVKVHSPDYVHSKDEQEVVKDFMERIKHYQDQYEALDESIESDYSFLKIFNAGEKVLVHKHEGHIQSRIVYYLMNVHLTQKTIYLTRHGESLFNQKGLIGGESELSERGHRFAKLLAEYVSGLNHPKLKVWTSWMTRTIQTTKYINGVQERWKALNEIDSGLCDGMTYAEIKEKFPEDFIARDLDKFGYRYPRGESYEDLVARLEPVIMELERQDSVLLVAHQAVLRCLLGYYLETSEEELPWLEVPLHTVIKLEPIAYGCKVQYIKFPVDCVSTHRKKPRRAGYLDERISRRILFEEKREGSPNLGVNLQDSLEITDHLNDDRVPEVAEETDSNGHQ